MRRKTRQTTAAVCAFSNIIVVSLNIGCNICHTIGLPACQSPIDLFQVLYSGPSATIGLSFLPFTTVFVSLSQLSRAKIGL